MVVIKKLQKFSDNSEKNINSGVKSTTKLEVHNVKSNKKDDLSNYNYTQKLPEKLELHSNTSVTKKSVSKEKIIVKKQPIKIVNETKKIKVEKPSVENNVKETHLVVQTNHSLMINPTHALVVEPTIEPVLVKKKSKKKTTTTKRKPKTKVKKETKKVVKKEEVVKQPRKTKKQTKMVDKKGSITLMDNKSTDVNNLLDKLHKQTSSLTHSGPFIETFSFLDDTPKVSRIKIKNFDVENLYSKIDNLVDKEIKKQQENKSILFDEDESIEKESKKLEKNIDSKKPVSVIEEIDIPNIIALKDDSEKLTSTLEKNYTSKEKDADKDHSYLPGFIDKHNKGLDLNPKVKDNIKKIDKHNKKVKEDNNKKEDLVKKKPKTNKTYEDTIKPVEQKNIAPTGNTFNFVLPADNKYYKDRPTISQQIIQSGVQSKVISNTASGSSNFDHQQQQFPNLVYSTKSSIVERKVANIYEKYSIDEFTFVTIKPDENNTLVYNLVQPELNDNQKKIFSEIKKTFLDSIDKNYYSFKGDKQSIQRYIQKIYDITLDKLSFTLSSLEKKLYFSFIKRDFSGLGFLENILNDKNILEISCAGCNMPITVYHIKYGAINTNLSFDKVSKLNIFVLSLTKLMGLHVNSNQPIISGHLPNGYKIEGIYSVGDISNRGSSFIIKKYLEEPLTPISLINLGVGAIDVFTYLWSAIEENYQIILIGSSDVMLFLNSVAQFYPNKKIITVQSYDDIRLPQENWIKRIIRDEMTISKKDILNQSISERPDYIILDSFNEELYDSQWFNINLLSIDPKQATEIVNKAKLVGQKTVVVDLKRLKENNQEHIQIGKIRELYGNNEFEIVKISDDNSDFKINLLSSNLDVVEFNRKKKILRWMLDSKLTDYKDFNNIVNDYNLNKNTLLKKLNIE